MGENEKKEEKKRFGEEKRQEVGKENGKKGERE